MAYDINKPNDTDALARTVKLPAMTQAMGNRIRASSNVASDLDRYDPGPPKEGDSRSITSMTPVASRSMSGNATPAWPANRGSMMTYGRGPK